MIAKRTRFFLAVEGKSEQSFVKWVQELSEVSLHIHLDYYPLNGGGFSSMLAQAVRFYKKGVSRGQYKGAFLLVDSDRSGSGDWSIEKLTLEAKKNKLAVCLQQPKHEGVLLRMMPGKENFFLDAISTDRQLKLQWPTYQKPVDARMLGQRFTIGDLVRMANSDENIRLLLQKIGLMT